MSNRQDLVLLSDSSKGTTARASSVLQKNSKLYGPMNAFDYENKSNCWNSEGSSDGNKECFFVVDFGRKVKVVELRIQFQAGFSAELMTVLKQKNIDKRYEVIDEHEVDDEHDLQTFVLEESDDVSALKLVFEEFTDFYGRVTIYQLQAWGSEVSDVL